MKIKRDWVAAVLATGVALAVSLTGVNGQAAQALDTPVEQEQQSNAFQPGQPWNDTDGATIQAHGGQVVAAHDDEGNRIWYWYGEDHTNGYASSPGVHVYSSYDLYNWKNQGLALRTMSSATQFQSDTYFKSLYAGYTDQQKASVFRDLNTVPPGPDMAAAILERPKVIYNAKDKKWVMWVHADGPTATSTAQYAKAQAGVAVSDSPFGPFRYIDSYRLDVAPAGEPNYQPNSPGMARDMNLFVDDDGTGYIIYSSEENYSMFISKLSADYTGLSAPPSEAVKGVDFTRPYIGAHREAPALFKRDGTYYLITSGATGWAPNAASYATAANILGPWNDRGNPAQGPGASTTFGSQSTSVIPYDPEKGKFIFMGDRWTPDDLAKSPYVWLPLSFGEGGSLSLENPATWSLHDLKRYVPWQVTSILPDHAWLNDASTLPASVNVESRGMTRQVAVTWDTSTLGTPGSQTLKGTLADGRTFTRQILVVPHNLKYVVNSGGAATADWSKTVDVAKTEGTVLNSSPEEALGTDPVSGTNWGFTGDSGTYGDAAGNLYTTLRWAKNKATLDYSFSGLQAGTYTIYVGYYDPWPWANRAASVTVNGTVVDANRLYAAQEEAGTYPGIRVGADGKVSVAITPTRAPDIQVSWIMVSRTS